MTPRRDSGALIGLSVKGPGSSRLLRDAGVPVRQALVIDGRAGSRSDAEPWSLVAGGGVRRRGGVFGAVPERLGGTGAAAASLAGEGPGGSVPPTSEYALDERVAEQDVCGGTPLLLHKHLPQEVPAGVRHPLGQRGLRRLRGDLKNGRHGLVFGPRRFLGQHFHDGAGHTPEDKDRSGRTG